MRYIYITQIEEFGKHLIQEEKSRFTVEKYIRDITAFSRWLNGKGFDKSGVIEYKAELMKTYSPASVNSAISSLNSFFTFCEWHELKTKTLKIQRRIFSSEEKELTKEEYYRLLNAARHKNNERLYMILQTICSTGIRVSELCYITVEALMLKTADISGKGKRRKILLPDTLCKMLVRYAKSQKIKSGPVFITKTGKPLDRSNIWADMKKLCEYAGVSKNKVFPHNLRHLFARTYYSLQKDIVRLADILGHASINTTRIYTTENCEVHRKQIQRLGLLRC